MTRVSSCRGASINRLLGALALLCVLATAGGWLFRSGSHENAAPSVPAATSVSSEDAGLARISGVPDRPRFLGAGSPAPSHAANTNKALQTAAGSLRSYRMAFTENPIGSNAEITGKLLGQNSRGLRLLPANAPVNAKGELVDQWNQPIFFHQISAKLMEVRSAGPDQRMWNADDEILR